MTAREERLIRVLVAEDSAATREYLLHVLEQDPALQVVAVARNGAEAVDLIGRVKPDIVLMDIHMPRMDGYEATRQIMEQSPTPVVLVSSSYDADEVAMSFEALRAGALTVVSKPAGLDHPREQESARQLTETLRLMSEVRVVRRTHRTEAVPAMPAAEKGVGLPPASTTSQQSGSDGVGVTNSIGRLAPRVIAIGASTGGPGAIAQVLAQFGGTLNVPVLVAQHIAPGFCQGFASWLERSADLPVRLATDGEIACAGTVYIATDSAHLGVKAGGRLTLSADSGLYGFCPSATHLLHSIATAYRAEAVGVLLTGMGKDGATGLLDMRAAGAVTIAQDQASSVVYGMPGEAARIGAAIHVLSPTHIGQLLVALTSSREARTRASAVAIGEKAGLR